MGRFRIVRSVLTKIKNRNPPINAFAQFLNLKKNVTIMRRFRMVRSELTKTEKRNPLTT